eukprot:CAMPEP_0177773512 /NCGR_PEP_ID=MMETSP0491_2-20121128/12917_1 /TAXON_ID=63592 /ORGANISM="Tetraselmis chuii, Strain PLY429" /LENGTH=394 /DNA_ID=CAMNT_0019291637 /DNA_START=181 /DNA_END=1361 /DNA_ORIENTATION=-
MVMESLDTSHATTPPAAGLQLDEGRLLGYLKAAVPGVVGRGERRVTTTKFSHGQSNPTYLLQVGGQSLVLRKKPPGKLLASAHAVEREHRVQAALADTAVPVPRMLCLCTDISVLGTPFYVMEHIKGSIFVDPALPQLSPQQRGHVYAEAARTLAALHSVDPRSVGLADYGRPSNYCARQVKRWWGQYIAGLSAGQAPMPEMQALAEILRANTPVEDSRPSPGVITHGDFRLDNLIFRTDSVGGVGRVAAVLDWELSTLGDAWSDLAYCCQPYYLPTGLPILPSLPQHEGKLTLPLGIPSEAEFVDSYCALRGLRPIPHEKWNFYVALSLFRMASIVAGVHSRALSGNASASSALDLGSETVVRAFAKKALERMGVFDQSGAGSAVRVAGVVGG